jgi:hypothetical protein
MNTSNKRTTLALGRPFLPRFLSIASLVFFHLMSAPQEDQATKAPVSLLEVRLAEPMRWESGCLFISLDRTNHSNAPLFLTTMGPYFDIALDVSHDEGKAGEGFEWINISGMSDIRLTETNSLAPNATMHTNACLRPTVCVTNLQKKTHREIPVRGKLRVEVSYFLTKGDAENYWKWKMEGILSREMLWAKLFAEIPCTHATCTMDCSNPPLGVHGEVRMVPDVFDLIGEYNVQGKALTQELERKFPSCQVKP